MCLTSQCSWTSAVRVRTEHLASSVHEWQLTIQRVRKSLGECVPGRIGQVMLREQPQVSLSNKSLALTHDTCLLWISSSLLSLKLSGCLNSLPEKYKVSHWQGSAWACEGSKVLAHNLLGKIYHKVHSSTNVCQKCTSAICWGGGELAIFDE